jgi:hypothetical protein
LECGSLLPLLNSEFRVSISQLKIAGQLETQNWKLGTLKSGSKLPHSEGALRARKPWGIRPLPIPRKIHVFYHGLNVVQKDSFYKKSGCVLGVAAK